MLSKSLPLNIHREILIGGRNNTLAVTARASSLNYTKDRGIVFCPGPSLSTFKESLSYRRRKQGRQATEVGKLGRPFTINGVALDQLSVSEAHCDIAQEAGYASRKLTSILLLYHIFQVRTSNCTHYHGFVSALNASCRIHDRSAPQLQLLASYHRIVQQTAATTSSSAG